MARIAQIVSTAHYLPEHIVTNAELTARFAALGRPDVINKLGSRTGINQRFYVPKDWVTSEPRPCRRQGGSQACRAQTRRRQPGYSRHDVPGLYRAEHGSRPAAQTRRKECRYI